MTPSVSLPPKPTMRLLLVTGGLVKSAMQFDMHAVHLLSTPIGTESVSKVA
jgi:hypothetical protein